MKKKSGSHKTTPSNILVVLATLGQRPELLRKTLNSIKNQNIPGVDVVLVYPFKNKETEQLAKEFHTQEIDDPGSMSSAVNLGIKSAGGKYKYVTWIGDDDLLTPGSLAASFATLEANPDAVASFGYCDYINENGKVLFTSKAGRFAPWIMTWGPNFVPLPGSVFRLSSLLDLDNIFDESLKYAMDLDLFLRLQKLGNLVNTKRTVSCFRWHSSSTTVSNRNASLAEAEQIKRRYMPKNMRIFAPLWERPVRLATHIAARRVSSLART